MEATRELAPDEWASFLDQASEDLHDAEVSIEIVGALGPPQVEAGALALQTLTYDRRDDVFEVSAARGGPHLPSVLRHLVAHPERIAVDSPTKMAPTTIVVDDREGVRTVVRIARPADFTG